MSRVSLKISGAQGQGVNSVGEVCAKGLKNAGYGVFGYREYMSLIKGGHSSYQLDVSDTDVCSTETQVDILVCFNHHGLEENLRDVKKRGIILHQSGDWKFSARDKRWLKEQKITVLYLPVQEMLQAIGAPPILGNILVTALVWAVLGLKPVRLKELVREQFGHKGEKVLALNFHAIDSAVSYKHEHAKRVHVDLPSSRARWKNRMLLTGSEAMGLGIIHAGCRVYAGYPMTPSSPLLTFIANLQNRTGMVVKQAEDEITAAQMMSGAMLMGTRAATATSGGGFDLMTETLSLNGMIENPAVFVLAQRPGPATGLPTWTAQGDLLLACFGGHGEFARCVLSVSDSEDAFHLMPQAFNLAERFQTPVIVLTDKQIAEAIYTQKLYDQSSTALDRGQLITDRSELSRLLASDRYTADAYEGVSPRWLPGKRAATFCAQGDEHNADGSVDETSANAIAQMDKRLRKLGALREALPEPELYGAKNPEVLLVGWGSTKGPGLDVLDSWKQQQRSPRLRKLRVGYLHYQYLWPLKTEIFERLDRRARRTILVEGNAQGQLGVLLAQESGVRIEHQVLKYDGRPFFVDELDQLLRSHL